MTIPEMQEAILLLGWQFHEHVFLDRTTYIEFTQDRGNLVFNEYPRPADCVGWGRFPREQAWRMAYDYIVKGVRNQNPFCY